MDDALGNDATGADLPGDENAVGYPWGLTEPNTDQWFDDNMVGSVRDNFYNLAFTNVVQVGVDGAAPVFGTIAPYEPVDPTDAGGVYNTYGDCSADVDTNGVVRDYTGIAAGTAECGGVGSVSGLDDKVAGAYTGGSTDASHGYSGVAGHYLIDQENGCETDACMAAFTTSRREAVQLQAIAGGAPTTILQWVFAANPAVLTDPANSAGSTFNNDSSTPMYAHDAVWDTSNTLDGYRQQWVTTYDRAGNSRADTPTKEHIADKNDPNVGNVVMDPTPSFQLGQDYVWGGQTIDQVDHDHVDFAFDFNGIHNLQVYRDQNFERYPNNRPGRDADGISFRPPSLQLPLENVPQTTFGSSQAVTLRAQNTMSDLSIGSAGIILQNTSLSVELPFLGCLARFDEIDLATLNSHPAHTVNFTEPVWHRPRGGRWRAADHAFEDDGATQTGTYGLWNDQWNQLFPTSVPTCTSSLASKADDVDPAFDSGVANTWLFGVSAFTGGTFIPNPLAASNKLELAVSGQSGTWVTTVDISKLDLYYIDEDGRARLLSQNGEGWSARLEHDKGTGAQGRTFYWTWDGDDPHDLDATQQSGGYFFVYKLGNGYAFIWDVNSN
jgi:hypothetical protein